MTAVDEIFELGSALSTKSLSLRLRDRPLRLVLPRQPWSRDFWKSWVV